MQGKIPNKIKPLHMEPDRITVAQTTCMVQGGLQKRVAQILDKTSIERFPAATLHEGCRPAARSQQRHYEAPINSLIRSILSQKSDMAFDVVNQVAIGPPFRDATPR